MKKKQIALFKGRSVANLIIQSVLKCIKDFSTLKSGGKKKEAESQLAAQKLEMDVAKAHTGRQSRKALMEGMSKLDPKVLQFIHLAPEERRISEISVDTSRPGP